MKKKIFVLACFLVLPVLALFGCEKATSYSVSVFSSSSLYGTVSGSGTFKEGSNVTLTANSKNGSSFVAWVFQNNTQIQSGNGYTIKNTTEEEKVTKSTLTFKIKSSTQGRYTAVFKEDKMTYVKLKSFQVQAKDLDAEPAFVPVNMSLTVLQGDNLETAFDNNEITLSEEKQSVDTSKVLKLEPSTSKIVRTHIILTDENEENLFDGDFSSGITFQTSTPQTQQNSFSQKVDFAAGKYTITFTFTYRNQLQYDLILEYEGL